MLIRSALLCLFLASTGVAIAFPAELQPGDDSVFASKAGAQDDERVEEIAKLIRKGRDRVDVALFDELGRIGGEEAFVILEDAIESLKKEAPLAAAFAAFGHFAADEELSRRAAILIDGPARRSKGDVAMAATGALLALGVPALEGLEALVAFEKAEPEARALACDALVPLLASRGDTESLRTILVHASLSHRINPKYIGAAPPPRSASEQGLNFPRSHRGTVRDILILRASPADLELLAEFLGAPEVTRAWRLLLIEILSPHDDEVVTNGLARALNVEDASTQMAA
ncbi:MAG: hypothetical protein ACI82F_002782, partial [Planctomycetota bacterium]